MTASITELKTNPMQMVEAAGGEAIAILNRNKPAFYCVPATLYEEMMEMLEDAELAAIVRARENEPRIKVSLDEL
jgi:antitoxin StbD